MDTDDSRQGAAASPLGRAVSYRDTYAPELLFPIVRQLKRDEIGISGETLPFVGEDLWNAYELSWLNVRGKPVVAIATFRVPASSPRLIESKSLKLYLNSFNQHRFVDPTLVRDTLERDLSEAAGAPVAVTIEKLSRRPTRTFGYPGGVLLDEIDIDIESYRTDPSFLRSDRDADEVSETLYSHLLKSNCLVTGQPDWGTIVVRYIGPPIERPGLLRYIVSFRSHNEFHEQCVERVYCDVLERCAPRHLSVLARYTRRGGLDINPFRSSGHFQMPDNVFEVRQ